MYVKQMLKKKKIKVKEKKGMMHNIQHVSDFLFTGHVELTFQPLIFLGWF